MPKPPSHRPSEDYDYGDFLEAIRTEIASALDPLKRTLDETRDDVKGLRRETYTREMTDAKFEAVNRTLSEHGDDLKAIHTLLGNSPKEFVLRASTLAGLIWVLLQLLPHIMKGFAL